MNIEKALLANFNDDFARSYGPDAAYQKSYEFVKELASERCPDEHVPSTRQEFEETFGYDPGDPPSSRIDALFVDDTPEAQLESYMDSVCKKFGCPQVATYLREGFRMLNEAQDDQTPAKAENWQADYGTGGIFLHEGSADGFYAKEKDPIGYAILTNNVAMLKALHDGTAPTPENPWNVSGWEEDIDHEGTYKYSFEADYEHEFIQDWRRVVGETDCQQALRLMLQYVPDFWLCPCDFMNAFYAGYDKKLLHTLLLNYYNLIDRKDDPYNSYLPFEGVKISEVLDFLSAKEGQPAQQGQAVPEKVHSKQTYIRMLYKAIEPITKKLHSDSNWQAVWDIKDAWNKACPTLQYSIGSPNGGYRQNRDNTAKWKEYSVEITTPDNKKISGRICCNAAGTVEDPFSRYDVTLELH